MTTKADSYQPGDLIKATREFLATPGAVEFVLRHNSLYHNLQSMRPTSLFNVQISPDGTLKHLP